MMQTGNSVTNHAMYPYIYQSDSFTIGSYGVMLAIAYLVGRYRFIERFNQINEKPVNLELLIISLLFFGVVGAKVMFVIKNPERASFDDWGSLTSGSGFSSQGAVLSAIMVTMVFASLTKTRFDKLLDAGAPAAVLAYAIARVGCFLAGDDCYGKVSDLPWAMSFPHGVEPTENTVHPLPLYEVIYSLVIFAYLKSLEQKPQQPFFIFFSLMLWWGLCRFLVEFISTNPIKIWGMTGSQFGALLMFLAGLTFMLKMKPWQKTQSA